MTILDALRAWTGLLRFLRRTAVGEEIVITKAGVPIAHLLRLGGKEPRRPGLATGQVTEAFFEPLPVDELAAWQQ
jgi:antitoxin (DNA-binding transcriptional repressor) of toxin-antitoxin stability system